MYSASSIGAVELIVMLVLTLSSEMPLKRTSMSFRELVATPTLPTSPRAIMWSLSYPICVGRSKATLRPVCPWPMRNLYLSLDSLAVPKPAYCLMVHRRLLYMVG